MSTTFLDGIAPQLAVIEKTACPVCNAECCWLPAVDFNKSCAGDVFDSSGIDVNYVACNSCAFCCAPEICTWTLQEFEQKIYNADYILVDPDYAEIRPSANAVFLKSLFGALNPSVRHLDYGGGNGRLAQILCASDWQSRSSDPFVHKDIPMQALGQFEHTCAALWLWFWQLFCGHACAFYRDSAVVQPGF